MMNGIQAAVIYDASKVMMSQTRLGVDVLVSKVLQTLTRIELRPVAIQGGFDALALLLANCILCGNQLSGFDHRINPALASSRADRLAFNLSRVDEQRPV